MAQLLSFRQYISPHSGEVPKTRSLERKQQEPMVLTKWRHSTYLLDVNDKVSVEMLERLRGFHGCLYAAQRRNLVLSVSSDESHF